MELESRPTNLQSRVHLLRCRSAAFEESLYTNSRWTAETSGHRIAGDNIVFRFIAANLYQIYKKDCHFSLLVSSGAELASSVGCALEGHHAE